jgi:predicted O-linked N-acetylglucosamine transferase (SPINDLY family)
MRGRSKTGKIRVGYVSAFFGSRNWMKPVWGVVNHHDRSTFEIHLFADRARPSSASGYHPDRRDVVHDITHLSNEAVARRVRRAGIDVLVDLNAYSVPSRLGLFVLRPAPVLVGWFNTYATTGIDAFDYVVGDDAVIPRSEERFYTERVLRVPGSYLAFSVLYPCPRVAPPPCLGQAALTFGSLASQYKITEPVVSAWSAILRGAPEARLLLKNRALDDASTRSFVLRRFVRNGVAPSRIVLEGSAEHTAFLRAYARVDIALDPFPYSGGTTTMEALWQGVPVLTHDGDRWASRTSRSLLLAAGLDEWCTPDLRSYIERAVALAQAPDTPRRLSTLRRSLRARLRDSPACDSAGLARSLEGLYRQIVY